MLLLEQSIFVHFSDEMNIETTMTISSHPLFQSQISRNDSIFKFMSTCTESTSIVFRNLRSDFSVF
jgi:hypothetical protein